MTELPKTSDRLQLAASYLLVICLLLTLHAGAMFLGLTPVLKGQMPDTDTYTRLVRVEELVKGGGWFNSTTERMNAPYGDTLNWTRPLDVLIVAAALPLHQQFGLSWHEALFWGGAVLPPLLQALFGLAVAWMVAPFFSAMSRPLLLLFVCAQPIVFAYSLVGRPDHQTLLLISAALMLGFVIRALLREGPALRLGLWAGLWAGFGLWVSTEFEFSLALVVGTLALMWLWQGERRMIELLEGIGIGFVLMTLAAVLIERGTGQWASLRELDKVSLSQLIGACINCGLWGMVGWLCPPGAGITRRAGALVGMAGAALFLLFLLAPELLRGPAGDIDPRVMKQFFLNIREMRRLWPKDGETFGLMSICLGVPLLALPIWLFMWRREALSPWLPLVALVAGFTVMGFFHARFSQFAAPFGAVFLLAVTLRVGYRLRERPLFIRAMVQAGLLVAPILIALAAINLKPSQPGNPAVCKVALIRETLDKLPRGIVFSPLNYGPELIYFTAHDTVAGPYHRNTRGILDSYDFFGTATDDEARRILRVRGVDYVLACPDRSATPETRAYRLTHGEVPSWLSPVELPEGQDFRLFRVNPAGVRN